MAEKTLVLAKKHPACKYRLLQHEITHVAKTFDLTDEEIKLLKTPEYKVWVKEVKVSNKKEKAMLD